jgi:HSP20 family molecular chaperone IbpA
MASRKKTNRRAGTAIRCHFDAIFGPITHIIDAEFKNGVLIVHLPKQEAAKPKHVPIKVQA